MSVPRALLTDGERAAVRGDDDDMTASTRNAHLARIRKKIEKMTQDTRDLREHRPDIYDQLHEAVCEQSLDERITDLESEIVDLEARLNELEGSTQG